MATEASELRVRVWKRNPFVRTISSLIACILEGIRESAYSCSHFRAQETKAGELPSVTQWRSEDLLLNLLTNALLRAAHPPPS